MFSLIAAIVSYRHQQAASARIAATASRRPARAIANDRAAAVTVARAA